MAHNQPLILCSIRHYVFQVYYATLHVATVRLGLVNRKKKTKQVFLLLGLQSSRMLRYSNTVL